MGLAGTWLVVLKTRQKSFRNHHLVTQDILQTLLLAVPQELFSFHIIVQEEVCIL